MIDLRKVLTLLACCCVCLTVATTTSADFVGVVAENKIDAETQAQCVDLTVCNVSIQFSDDGVAPDRLLSVAFADVQVLGSPDGQFNQVFFGADVPYNCSFLPTFPGLICDSYVTIGEKCFGEDSTVTDADFNMDPDDIFNRTDWFNDAGQIFGGWLNSDVINGLGDAFGPLNPEGKILILQSVVAVGLSVEGTASILWQNIGDPSVFEEVVEIVCQAKCQPGNPGSDGDPCTFNDICGPDGSMEGTPLDCSFLDDACNEGVCDPSTVPGTCVQVPTNEDGDCDDGDACTADEACSGGECIGGTPIDCDDGNCCTDDGCDPASGCTHDQVSCPDGGACDPDSCECVVPPLGFLDIIPGKCPNRLQRNGLGFLKVSLVSTGEADGGPFDACEVDVSTIQLCRADGSAGCAQPTSTPAPRCEDRATPFLGELCGCHGLRKDGIDDLDMRFKVADVVNNLGLVDMPAGVPVGLELTALTNDGQTVIARDCVELGRDLGPNP